MGEHLRLFWHGTSGSAAHLDYVNVQVSSVTVDPATIITNLYIEINIE